MSVSNLPISEDHQGYGPKKAALCGAKRQKRVRGDGEASTASLSKQQEHVCRATKAYSAIGHAIEAMHRKRYHDGTLLLFESVGSESGQQASRSRASLGECHGRCN